MELNSRFLTSGEQISWNEFVVSAVGGTIYSHTDYLDILCRHAGGRFRILGIFRKDELLGGCALYERPSKFGWYIQNRLLLYYNSPVLSLKVAAQNSLTLQVCQVLSSELHKLNAPKLVLHARGSLYDFRGFLSEEFAASPSYTYVVSISNLETAWEKMHKNQRRLVRKSREAGLTLQKQSGFEDFFRLHELTHQRKGAPLYLPKSAFEGFVRELQEKNLGCLYAARTTTGETAASQLVLSGPFSRTHTVCAGAAAEHQSIGATPFLRWSVMEDLSELGYAEHDLTDAAPGSVTRFKEQLGGNLEMNMVLRMSQRWDYRTAESLRSAPWKFKQMLKSILQKEDADGEG